MDVNKDGLVDMCEYIVVISLAAHLYPNSDIDFSKLDAKLISLTVCRCNIWRYLYIIRPQSSQTVRPSAPGCFL